MIPCPDAVSALLHRLSGLKVCDGLPQRFLGRRRLQSAGLPPVSSTEDQWAAGALLAMRPAARGMVGRALRDKVRLTKVFSLVDPVNGVAELVLPRAFALPNGPVSPGARTALLVTKFKARVPPAVRP